MFRLSSAIGRPQIPYLMAMAASLLIGLAAIAWTIESRTAARDAEAARLAGLSEAFTAYVGLTLDRYTDLLDRVAELASEERDFAAPRMASEILLQNPYLLGIRHMEGLDTVMAVERPGSLGALSWPAFNGAYGAVDTFDTHMHTPGLLHTHKYLANDGVIEIVIDRQALLNAMAPLIDTPGRSIGLFTTDGHILARVPDVGPLNQPAVRPPVLRQGRLLETRLSPFDGLERLVSWRLIDGQQLLLAATMPLDVALAAWRQEAEVIAAAWTLVTMVSLMVARGFSRASASAEAASQAQRRNEAELQALFHQNLQLLGLLDCDGRLRRVNETALMFAETTEDAVLGKPFWETPWWQQDAASQAGLRAALSAAAGGATRTFTSLHSDGAGQKYTFEVSLSPVTDDRGRITGILAEGRDITMRLQAEQDAADQRRRLELALDSTEQGMWDWTVDTGAAVYSDRLFWLLGYAPRDWPGHRDIWDAHIDPQDRDRVQAALDVHLNGQMPRYHCEYRMHRRDGGRIWVLSTGKVIEWDDKRRPLRVIGTHTDITARREAEEQLKTLAKALENSNRNLEQFAYIASHDLQEPLRMVSSYLGLLTRRKADALDDEALEFIAYASDGAQRMSRLITDLLDYSRVSSRGQRFAPASLADVVDAALRNLTVALQESGAVVTVADDLPTLSADEGQLIQLFQNLIGNAIKYARTDIPPRIDISVDRHPGGWRVAVRDNGIGIEPAYRERIFRLFQRLHNRDQFSGTGIGLAVAQRIVERHGGHLWVEDAEARDWTQGCAFIIQLPDTPANRQSDVQTPPAAADQKQVF